MATQGLRYTTIISTLACAAFFATGARMHGRPPFLWGAPSLGA